MAHKIIRIRNVALHIMDHVNKKKLRKKIIRIRNVALHIMDHVNKKKVTEKDYQN